MRRQQDSNPSDLFGHAQFQDGSARLDATLAAADLVICETSCVSHNACRRVKHHCRRTGKHCVSVQTPSTAVPKRALVQLAPHCDTPAAVDQPVAEAS